MKQSSDSPKKKKLTERFGFWVAAFFVVMVTIYLYVMLADLSTAPKFIYSQF